MENYLNVSRAPLAFIQDYGRYGYEHYGVSVNGASDSYAYLMGNELVGNTSPEPSIEVIAFDFYMTSTTDVLFCVTGAPADLAVDSIPIRGWETAILPAGKKLSIKHIRQGLKVYIAVAGGIDVPMTLGSCALDTVAKLGLRLSSGQQLKLKAPTCSNEHRATPPEIIPQYGAPWHIRMCEGPDMDIFANNIEKFLESVYTVSVTSNHIGIRLEGPLLEGFQPREVLSRGVAIGAIEVVASGQPIVLHRGRTIVAGYPVIGVVSAVDLGMIGQARPKDEVRFSLVSIQEAERLYREEYDRFAYLTR